MTDTPDSERCPDCGKRYMQSYRDAGNCDRIRVSSYCANNAIITLRSTVANLRASLASATAPSEAEHAVLDIVLAWRKRDLALECAPGCGCLDELADAADRVLALRAEGGG